MSLDLTISIPTYNRPDLLAVCLDSVIESINYSKTDIEILVSDNCSNLSYDDVIEQMKKKYSKITYIRNKKNVRDLNFYLCAERAKTNYVWVFSDDDVMNIDAISLVNKYISKNPNIIVTNYSLYDFQLKNCLKKNFLSLKLNHQYYNHENVMKDFGFRLSFLSCIIFKRDDFLELPKNLFQKYVKYQFPFLLAIYSMIYKKCYLIFIKKSLIVQRGNKAHADSEWWYKIFVTGSNMIFKYLNKIGYSYNSILSAKRKLIWYDILKDIIFRKLNNEKLSDKIKLICKNYYDLPFSLTILIVTILTPNYFLRFVYRYLKN